MGGNDGYDELASKTVLVTGGNAGIGFQTAIKLAKANAKTIIACRDEKKAIDAVNEIKRLSNNDNIEYILVDLSSLESIDRFAAEFSRRFDVLDVLVNNAGILASSLTAKSKDGYELTFATNVFGPFLLTLYLIPFLSKSKHRARIIFVSSLMHKYGRIEFETLQMWSLLREYYNQSPEITRNFPISAPTVSANLNSLYSNTKLANILLSNEFDKRLREHNIRCYSLNPGAVKTDILKDFGWFIRVFGGFVLDRLASIGLFMKTAENGANTSFLLCHSKLFEEKGGEYFSDEKIKTPSISAVDPFSSASLYNYCWELVDANKRLEDSTLPIFKSVSSKTYFSEKDLQVAVLGNSPNSFSTIIFISVVSLLVVVLSIFFFI